MCPYTLIIHQQNSIQRIYNDHQKPVQNTKTAEQNYTSGHLCHPNSTLNICILGLSEICWEGEGEFEIEE